MLTRGAVAVAAIRKNNQELVTKRSFTKTLIVQSQKVSEILRRLTNFFKVQTSAVLAILSNLTATDFEKIHSVFPSQLS